MKQIIVEVTEDGTVKIEAMGFTGAACEKATAEIEKALGVPGKRTKKPEYFQGANQAQRVKQ
jgi:hypothetical protein